MFRCYLALGSNLGDREAAIRDGIASLEACGIRILRRASLYSTEPRGLAEQPHFLNTVVEAETTLEPDMLMAACLRVEQFYGRERSVPNAPRTLDIDIILIEDRIIRDEGLRVPHPRFRERRFVLTPLAEIAPAIVDPESGETIATLLEGLDDPGTVTLWDPAPPPPGPD